MTREELIFGSTANIFGSDLDPNPVQCDLDAERRRAKWSRHHVLWTVTGPVRRLLSRRRPRGN